MLDKQTYANCLNINSGGKTESSYGIWLLGTQNKNLKKSFYQDIQNSTHFANMYIPISKR